MLGDKVSVLCASGSSEVELKRGAAIYGIVCGAKFGADAAQLTVDLFIGLSALRVGEVVVRAARLQEAS